MLCFVDNFFLFFELKIWFLFHWHSLIVLHVFENKNVLPFLSKMVYLSIKVTALQQPITSVPQVATVERVKLHSYM